MLDYYKVNLMVLAHILTDIVNFSLSTGKFLDQIKHVIVSPIIKKRILMPTNWKISDRYLISLTCLRSKNLGEPLQSTYKSAHSTKSALKNDIIKSCLSQEMCLSGYLRLKCSLRYRITTFYYLVVLTIFDIQGNVLQWMFFTYLVEQQVGVGVGVWMVFSPSPLNLGTAYHELE